jgi:zinc protease
MPKSPSPSVLLEENHSLPLCRVQVTLRAGAACDAAPDSACGLKNGEALDGLANFATELQRRGAGGKSRAELDEAIDGLGSSVHVLCWHDQILFEAMALKENIDAACAILADVLLRPDFPASEAEKLRRELAAQLDDLRDDDSGLMQRFFGRAMYGSHPYGRPVGGTAQSVPRYSVKLARAWVGNYLTRENVMFGAAGDLKPAEATALFTRHFGKLPEGPRRDPAFTAPERSRGLRLVLVDKPERTQSQILIGQLGPHWSDKNWLPLLVATTAFGGMFTARLMDEVRVKRGLSYGASARLGSGRGQRALCAHVFPAADKTAETLDLVLSLYRDWAEKGLRKEEVVFSKSYLQKSHAFTIQTADDRLNLTTRLALCGMPLDYATTFPERIAAIDEKSIKKAMTESLFPDDLLITIVGTASTLLPQLKKLPVLKKAAIEVVKYDSY